MVCGWWKRGRTSIQPAVPKTRAWPGSACRSEVVSVADRPSPYVEQHRGLRVDAGREQRPGRRHRGRRTEQHLRERHHVDAEVEQGAATLGEVEQPVRGVVRGGHAQVGLDRAHLTDRAVVHQLAQRDDRRLEAGPHRLHREDAGLPREVDDLGGPGGGRGERLLDQQGLAGAQRRDGDGVVLRVRRRQVDHVDVRVGQDLRVRPVRALDPVPGGERLRALHRPGGDGDRAGPVDDGEVLRHLVRDAARPDDAPANLRGHPGDASGDPNRCTSLTGRDCHPWPS